MWLQIELPQPALVTEVQFDSVGAGFGGGGGGRGRGAAPLPAPGTPAPAGRGGAPTMGYPRAYSVQVSTDGKKWSKPVAEGKGEGGHTTISFAPVRAQYVRITQTDNINGAPPWSVRNLRVYEAKGGGGTK
jgi:hypothetical protein